MLLSVEIMRKPLSTSSPFLPSFCRRKSKSKKEIINRGILISICGRDIDVPCLNHRNNRVRNINY